MLTKISIATAMTASHTACSSTKQPREGLDVTLLTDRLRQPQRVKTLKSSTDFQTIEAGTSECSIFIHLFLFYPTFNLHFCGLILKNETVQFQFQTDIQQISMPPSPPSSRTSIQTGLKRLHLPPTPPPPILTVRAHVQGVAGFISLEKREDGQ